MRSRDESRLERGRDLEGYAFTFCKAAFIALLFSKYTLLVSAVVAAALYVAAYLYGVREWRCFVKPPYVVVFFVVVAAVQAYFLFWHRPAFVMASFGAVGYIASRW